MLGNTHVFIHGPRVSYLRVESGSELGSQLVGVSRFAVREANAKNMVSELCSLRSENP